MLQLALVVLTTFTWALLYKPVPVEHDFEGEVKILEWSPMLGTSDTITIHIQGARSAAIVPSPEGDTTFLYVQDQDTIYYVMQRHHKPRISLKERFPSQAEAKLELVGSPGIRILEYESHEFEFPSSGQGIIRAWLTHGFPTNAVRPVNATFRLAGLQPKMVNAMVRLGVVPTRMMLTSNNDTIVRSELIAISPKAQPAELFRFPSDSVWLTASPQ